MRSPEDNRSLGKLFSDLGRQLSTLMRRELDLAKAELSEGATHVGRNVASLAVGALVAYAGLLVLLIAVVLLLIELGVTPWLAALIVGLVVVAIGAFLVWRGIQQLRNTDLAPRATVETVREDIEMIKEHPK